MDPNMPTWLSAPFVSDADLDTSVAIVRLITALPWLQGIPARLIALGVRPEHVQSKAAPAS